MEHSVKTIPGTWYTITSTAPATVIELIQGEIATLATLKKSGTDSFRPSTTQVTVNTEGKFTALPTKAPGAPFLGTGGNVQFTDEQAEQLQTLAEHCARTTSTSLVVDTPKCSMYSDSSVTLDGKSVYLNGGGNWMRLDENGVQIANTHYPAYLRIGSDDDRLAVLPLGVKTAMGADAYGLSVSVDGGLQLWGTHFLQGDAHADNTLKIVHNSLSLGSTDTAALGFDYANTVTFRTFPNDGSTANDNAGGVYRFEAWQWSDDSHTSKEEMAVDVRKPNAGVLCDESLMNRAEVLAAIEDNAPVPDLPIAADKTDVTAPSASGKNSTAVGYKAAAGLSSTSLGYNSRALDSSTAVGVNATAEGIANIVVGNNAQASSNDSVAVGNDAKASAYYSIAVGKGANASSASTALGYIAKATGGSTVVGASAQATSNYTIAVGASAQATMPYSMALGYQAKVADKGATVIGAWDGSNIKQTLLYLIGSGSPLATTYEDGAACLGYVVKDTNGNIIECGTRKLSELLTNNTAFAPASMDLDAPAPTPFMPTGITDPIEPPAELENEPEILTDTTQQ